MGQGVERELIKSVKLLSSVLGLIIARTLFVCRAGNQVPGWSKRVNEPFNLSSPRAEIRTHTCQTLCAKQKKVTSVKSDAATAVLKSKTSS